MTGPEVAMQSEANVLERTVDIIVLPEDREMAGFAERLPGELLRDAVPWIEKVPEEMVISRMRHHWSAGRWACGVVMGARLEEERLRGNANNIVKLGDLNLYDRSSIFGRPELCVLSRWGMNWSNLPGDLSVAYVCSYERLAREYITGLVRGGFGVEEVPVEGCLGDHIDLGSFDLAIGILCKGAVLERTGMFPLDRIWDEGPVLIRTV